MTHPPHPAARILVVEDNETIRGAFTILLEESGYEVIQAETGAEALEMVRSRGPDLVLMDLGLPDGNGLEITRRLKADPATADVAVVALTGRALESDQNACLAAGCIGYMAKPVDTHQLLRKIPRYLAGEGD